MDSLKLLGFIFGSLAKTDNLDTVLWKEMEQSGPPLYYKIQTHILVYLTKLYVKGSQYTARQCLLYVQRIVCNTAFPRKTKISHLIQHHKHTFLMLVSGSTYHCEQLQPTDK
jgi:hypothetical protein